MLVGGVAAAWPVGAHAQQAGKLPTIGFLGQSTPLGESERAAVFAQRLRELGWIEGVALSRSNIAGRKGAVSASLRSQPSLSGSRSMSLSRREPRQ
jgi:hypothetical protein